jgi:ribosomal protein S19E (S16A)
MQTPEINLSPIERKLLNAISHGNEDDARFDWVAFQRLRMFGFVEETDTGRIQVTAEGKSALRPGKA